MGKREGKYNGVGAVTEDAARIIKERGIRRYTFWEKGKVSITAWEPLQRRWPITSKNGESEGTHFEREKVSITSRELLQRRRPTSSKNEELEGTCLGKKGR